MLYQSVFFLFTPPIYSHICATYTQPHINGLINYKAIPQLVGYKAHCTTCYSIKHANEYEFGCMDPVAEVRISQKKTLLSMCKNQSTEITCRQGVCCCSNLDCYDRFRMFHSLTEKNKLQDIIDQIAMDSCYLFSKKKGIGMKNDKRKEKVILHDYILQNKASKRLICGLCMMRIRMNSLEALCLEKSEVGVCDSYKTMVGNAVNCNPDQTECCCKGPACAYKFLEIFHNYVPSPDKTSNSSNRLFTSLSTLFLTIFAIVNLIFK
ncbi:unnamed protein product [Bursaphelenchus okinawaensis]|uniref:Uncharacterized protein n=1 Tax=Bursaphelenchus okinawaensis TaxID=465554 RepID=A0A811JRV9_9BILA|nr:unnamed protein product [Bursaphelenchus okinawaensis]CAG9079655.1 unnamed protein product [Bursaphelenchus okinawaensis]